jgi:hypothetical protein
LREVMAGIEDLERGIKKLEVPEKLFQEEETIT